MQGTRKERRQATRSGWSCEVEKDEKTAGMTKNVQPTPASPQPAAKAEAVPMTFLSNQAAMRTWHGTKTAPAMPCGVARFS